MAKAKATTATGKVVFITKPPANAIYVGFAGGYPKNNKPLNASGFGTMTKGWDVEELWLGEDADPKDALKAGLNLGLEFNANNFYPDWDILDDVSDQIEYGVEDFLKKNPSLKITLENYDEYFEMVTDVCAMFNVYVLPVGFDVDSLPTTFEIPGSALEGTIKDMDREIKQKIKDAKSTGGKKGKAEQIIKQMKALQKQLNEFK